jgi:hypothetical protein
MGGGESVPLRQKGDRMDTPYYYNTNKETGDTLTKSHEQAKGQEDQVQAFFEKYPELYFSREQVHKMVLGDKVYFTSVQRCLTNLTHRGILEKSKEPMFISSRDKKVYGWAKRGLDNANK